MVSGCALHGPAFPPVAEPGVAVTATAVACVEEGDRLRRQVGLANAVSLVGLLGGVIALALRHPLLGLGGFALAGGAMWMVVHLERRIMAFWTIERVLGASHRRRSGSDILGT